MNINDIPTLIASFLDGTTTLEEERRLYQFFQEPDIPAELEEYRSMFIGYSQLDHLDTPCHQPSAPPLAPHWLRTLSIASSAAAAIIIALVLLIPHDTSQPYILYSNGRTITDESIVMDNMENTMNQLFSDYQDNDLELQMNKLLTSE